MDCAKELENLITIVASENASDLHLSEGRRPFIRVAGFMVPLLKRSILTEDDMKCMIDILLNEENKKIFLQTKEVDFSYGEKSSVRFRGNGYFHRGRISFALRVIPRNIRGLEELNLPPILETFVNKRQGFFLAVGPVGHGKTTTLAAMVEGINQERAEHIITIEDPIEYIFEQKKAIIDQREIRLDTDNFGVALQSTFRQDVNVIMIGEMRGLETVATAVTAAETGHLVLSTLHTNTAAQTIDRIIDSFPAGQQEQVRVQLAGSLAGIFSQRLVPRVSGGLIPAYELLINTPAVSNLIREGRTHEIPTSIETGVEHGMIDLNRCLADLVRKGEITQEDAFLYSYNPKALERSL
jgi:twitching motility protein PilT